MKEVGGTDAAAAATSSQMMMVMMMMVMMMMMMIARAAQSCDMCKLQLETDEVMGSKADHTKC